MPQVLAMNTCRVKPGRIDDAMAVWKNIKKGSDAVDFYVSNCAAGGPYTGLFLVAFVYPDANTMVEAGKGHEAEIEALWRESHSAESPFEAIESSTWVPIDLD